MASYGIIIYNLVLKSIIMLKNEKKEQRIPFLNKKQASHFTRKFTCPSSEVVIMMILRRSVIH